LSRRRRTIDVTLCRGRLSLHHNRAGARSLTRFSSRPSCLRDGDNRHFARRLGNCFGWRADTRITMGYDRVTICREVSRLLSQQPGRTLTSIAQELGVDRHTITRDLKRLLELTFHQLRLRYIREALARFGEDSRPLLRKELANRLGLASTRSLRGWLRQLQDRSRNAETAPKRPQVLQRRGRR
jgi:HTH domain.